MKQGPGYIHMVYFWLKDGVNEQDKQDFFQGVASLGNCQTVGNIFIGPPAMTPRDVVDNTYDYALLAFFKDKQAHDAYQDDPDHYRFIDQFKHLWAKVQVYDHLPVR